MKTEEIKKENKIKDQEQEIYDNVIKIGTFQLQTKSFWLGLIAMLTLFLFGMVWLNNHYNSLTIKDLIEENTKLISILEKK